ncbi:MAG TPA: DUF5666 domain-containing protein [Gemmatimonadaceae bacterium]|nr:DUF5666 domain-containing protein [Gemmatimonadaceae bacterium]
MMSRRLFAAAATTLAIIACTQRADKSPDTTIASSTSTAGGDTIAMVRGTVASASPTQLVVTTSAGNDTIALKQPLQVYSRQPATLADVKDNVFIGVTTVKQPDGSERATEIHIFPEELRGLGEGSRMMSQNGGGNRMTNGAVSNSRMTNGTASPSRMSNGNVANANGSTLDVQYAGGSQKVVVPPNTRVTQIKATSKQLAAGDRVAVQAKKAPDGSLSTSKVMLAGS